MRRRFILILSAFLLVCVSSFVWHWSAAIRIGNHECRFETQFGEMAFTLWLGSPDYVIQAPLCWAHEADARTRLADACPSSFAGIGWVIARSHYLQGARSAGVVVPWWYCLLGLVALWNPIPTHENPGRGREVAASRYALRKSEMPDIEPESHQQPNRQPIDERPAPVSPDSGLPRHSQSVSVESAYEALEGGLPRALFPVWLCPLASWRFGN